MGIRTDRSQKERTLTIHNTCALPGTASVIAFRWTTCLSMGAREANALSRCSWRTCSIRATEYLCWIIRSETTTPRISHRTGLASASDQPNVVVGASMRRLSGCAAPSMTPSAQRHVMRSLTLCATSCLPTRRAQGADVRATGILSCHVHGHVSALVASLARTLGLHHIPRKAANSTKCQDSTVPPTEYRRCRV